MCELTSGYSKLCDSAGGVETLYMFSLRKSDGTSNYAIEPTVVNGEVTAIALKPGVYAYPFNVEVETASMQDTASGESANGSYARTQTVTAVLHGNTAEMINNIDKAARGRVVVIGKLNDGSYEIYFLRNGGKLVDDRTTGTAMEDLNGNTLTITGKEMAKAPKISSTLVNSLLEPVS